MASKTEALNGAGAVDVTGNRHFADTGPMYADPCPSAADVKARGAADRMWKKVREDLERIDRAPSEEADDE